MIFRTSPLLFPYNDVITKTFQQFMLKKNLRATPYAFTFSKSSCILFRWTSLYGPDSRPQLTAVSGLFGGNPFVGGI
jgi:hypothetical protein